MLAYYLIVILILIVSAFFLVDSIVISIGSLAVLMVIAVSVIQIIAFRAPENETFISGVGDSFDGEIDKNASIMARKYHATAKLIMIPLLLPLLIYLGTAWKIGLSIGIYFLSFFPVIFVVNIKRGKKNG